MHPADREVELKLGVRSESARVAAARELTGARSRALESTYFDTPDGKLREAGFALRVRKDRGIWWQTLKGEANDGLQRYEHERRVKTPIPDRFLLGQTPAGRLIADDDELQPVFMTKIRRRSADHTLEAGKIEFSLDEGEIVADGRSAPILELELELKAGEANVLFDEARRLAGEADLVPAFASKAERGFALVAGETGEPVKFRAPSLAAGASAAAAFQAIARACLRQLTDNAALIGEGGRIEAVHQARIALRRLRVAITVFKDILTGKEREQIKGELKQLAKELDWARNLDVFVFETFRPQAREAADPAPMAAFGRDLLAAQKKAYAQASAAVEGERFRTLVVDAARWVENGSWREDPLSGLERDTPVEEFAPAALSKRRKVMRKQIRRLDWRDPHERHRLRIQAKKMRYASEFFASLPQGRKRRYRTFAKKLETLQDCLGRLNDIHVGEETARAAAAQAPPEGARHVHYAAGLMVGRTQAETPALLKHARHASRAFLEAKPWW